MDRARAKRACACGLLWGGGPTQVRPCHAGCAGQLSCVGLGSSSDPGDDVAGEAALVLGDAAEVGRDLLGDSGKSSPLLVRHEAGVSELPEAAKRPSGVRRGKEARPEPPDPPESAVGRGRQTGPKALSSELPRVALARDRR